VGERLIDQLVAEGCLRDATEIAVEGWLAFVRAACVKWIQSQELSRADLTKMCLRALDCALDLPTPTSRLRRWRIRKLIAGDMHNPEYLGSHALGSSARCDGRS
jgi:hypothetical protein